MGRTLLPYSMQIDMVLARFKEFRRGLRRQDQEVFDQLIRYARRQLQAGTMAAHPNPFDAMSMTMLLELQKQLDDQDQRLTFIERQLEDQEDQEDLAEQAGLEGQSDPEEPATLELNDP